MRFKRGHSGCQAPFRHGYGGDVPTFTFPPLRKVRGESWDSGGGSGGSGGSGGGGGSGGSAQVGTLELPRPVLYCGTSPVTADDGVLETVMLGTGQTAYLHVSFAAAGARIVGFDTSGSNAQADVSMPVYLHAGTTVVGIPSGFLPCYV